MTTNQTIDGVPRRTLGRALNGCGLEKTEALQELRALLDKEVSGDSRAPLPQGEPVADLIRLDRSYRNGLMAGFQFGITGDEKGYAACIRRYNAGIQEAKGEQPAPVAVAAPDRIKGMVEAVGGEYAVMIDPDNRHFGWTFKRHPDGHWVSGRKATDAEMSAARSHAHITNQL